jgi:hypothetical protein
VLTLFLYLNDVEEGGETRFTQLNLDVKPRRGRAILWPSVLNEDPNVKDFRTEHEALVVTKVRTGRLSNIFSGLRIPRFDRTARINSFILPSLIILPCWTAFRGSSSEPMHGSTKGTTSHPITPTVLDFNPFVDSSLLLLESFYSTVPTTTNVQIGDWTEATSFALTTIVGPTGDRQSFSFSNVGTRGLIMYNQPLANVWPGPGISLRVRLCVFPLFPRLDR